MLGMTQQVQDGRVGRIRGWLEALPRTSGISNEMRPLPSSEQQGDYPKANQLSYLKPLPSLISIERTASTSVANAPSATTIAESNG